MDYWWHFPLTCSDSECGHACRTDRASVGLKAGAARASSGFLKLARNAVPAPEVHLIRRLPVERRMRKNAIVLIDVEGHQALEGRQIVKLVQETPVIFKSAPESLNHRVTETNVGLGNDASESTLVDELIDGLVEVLDAAIHHERSRRGHFSSTSARGFVGP